MKLTLDKITTARSLQRSWALTGAEPVRAYLPPYTEFAPADLRIWWNAKAGHTPEEHTFRIYAWPEERLNYDCAHWQSGYNQSPLPEWIRELSDVVHEDLIANATGPNTGVKDSWTYSVDRDWKIEDADPVPSLRYPHETFVPAELSIWHTYNAGLVPNENRYRITAYPAGRKGNSYGDWDGSTRLRDFDGTVLYKNLPGWIRDLAEDQHSQLVDFATLSEQERGTR